MKILKAGDPCPCCGRPIPEGLSAKRMLFLSWFAEGVTIKDAVGSMSSKETNESLTLEELARHNAPVWLKGKENPMLRHDGWVIIVFPNGLTGKQCQVWWPGSDVEDIPRLEDYGKTWAAYRRPPEAAEENKGAGT